MRNLIEILQAGSRYVSDLSKSEGKTMGKGLGRIKYAQGKIKG